MSSIKVKPHGKPKCPNHGCNLEGTGVIKGKGEGVCPVSGAHFTFEVETDNDKIVKDKFGNLFALWRVSGNE